MIPGAEELLERPEAFRRLLRGPVRLPRLHAAQIHHVSIPLRALDCVGFPLRARVFLTCLAACVSSAQFIAFQDDLFVQPAYVTAVSGIVSCYLRLQADRESAAAKQLEEEEAGESEDSKLSAADKKKLKAQRRREKQKKEKEVGVVAVDVPTCTG
jgi:hypothetical protein